MAYDFEESSSQRITYSTVHADYTTTVAISFWAKLESLPGAHQMHIVDKGINSSGGDRNISVAWTPASGGQIFISFSDSSNNYSEWTHNISLSTGVWQHWYLEVDWSTNPDTFLFWLDGVSKTLTNTFGTNNRTPSTDATQHLSLGGEHGSADNVNNFDGLLSDVAFWSDNVGSTRASGLYNSGAGGLAATLYPTNLVEDIPLRVDPDNRKGGTGTLKNTPTLSTDNPFSATILRSYSSNSSTTGTAVSVSAPTGTVEGDVVVVSVHCNNQTTIVDNNGSTSFTEDINDYKPNTSGGHTVSIFSRRIQSGDPSTYNFTIGTSGRWSIIANTYKDPHASDFYDVDPSTSNASNADDSSASTIDAPSITTLTNRALHVVHGYFDDGSAGNPTGPSGYYAAGADNDEPQVAVYKGIGTAGATGAQTVTGTSVAPRIALSYAIKDISAIIASTTYSYWRSMTGMGF